jgi:phospholipase/lecithinase/hemolysin
MPIKMNKLLHLMAILIFTLLYSPLSIASPKKIIFFGDSLTDNGNLYRDTLHYTPDSPPYYKGRFSNGPTWAENVGEYFLRHAGIPYEIYAWGGATLAFHFPSARFIAPITLAGEVRLYLLASLFSDRSENLYVIWIGDNDYLFFPNSDINATTNDSINSLKSAMLTLLAHGARHILVMNLTDASLAPEVRGTNVADNLHNSIAAHNKKLQPILDQLHFEYPLASLKLYDAYTFFNHYVNNFNYYNQHYHATLKDNTHACLILQTPCELPSDFIFWDKLHPSETFHRILGLLMIDQLEKDHAGTAGITQRGFGTA